MTDFPYVLSNGKVPDLFDAITSAGRPDFFNTVFLERLGFSSSNDRAFVSMFRKLGLVGDQNAPTPLYDDLRDPQKRGRMLARQMRSVYSDLFDINQSIQSSPDSEIRAAISRVTGKDELATTRMANTFKAFASQADFSAPAAPGATVSNPPSEKIEKPEPALPVSRANSTEFHYNIQIVLPSTTEIAVYNAIFKSIKDNLGL